MRADSVDDEVGTKRCLVVLRVTDCYVHFVPL